MLCLPIILSAQSNQEVKMKMLIVVSSYGKEQGKQRPGFEFDEFSQAWLIFKSNGLEIDVASPKGGIVEADEFNKTKPYNEQVLNDPTAMELLNNTIATSKIKPEIYDAVYIVGGKGAMFDLPFDPSLQEIIHAIYKKNNAIVSAVCHGPAAFVNVKDEQGKYLIAGKKITGFCNDEEDKFGKTWKSEFPFMLEDKLKARDTYYEKGEAMLPHVVVDGRIITGQNPFSTTLLAEETLKAMGINLVKREQYKDEKSMFLVKRALAGEIKYAKDEINLNHGKYDLELIAVYGYYKLIYADNNKDEIKSALDIIEMVTPWTFNKNLQFEMAKGYLQLNNKEKAKELLKLIIEKEPSFEDAKKLYSEIK